MPHLAVIISARLPKHGLEVDGYSPLQMCDASLSRYMSPTVFASGQEFEL
jgi:hypothetical protein